MKISEILKRIDVPALVHGNPDEEFKDFAPFDSPTPQCVTYITRTKFASLESLADLSSIQCLVSDSQIVHHFSDLGIPCLIEVEDARQFFALLVSEASSFGMSREEISHSIDPSAQIHPTATIEQGVQIGAESMISAGCVIKKGSVIGQNVMISEYTVIGKSGFGFVKNEEGSLIRFSHIGNVVLEDHVEIGSFVAIDRGSIASTRVCKGAKVDNFVHIAHNVLVGEFTMLKARATICGSVSLGSYCQIAPHAVIRDNVTVGEGSLVGLGAVVVKSVEPYKVVAGIPARVLRDLK